jgi:dTDP-4-dehydrorhamnose 3,5-epimerase
VAQVPQHYLLRTSWVIGAGHNFVRTMASLAAKGVSPTVVDDQYGRLTFTTDLAAAIVYLLSTGAAPGTYNFTNPGPIASWCDIAKQVFELSGRSGDDVTPTSTEAHAAGKLTAPRPRHSALELAKIEATGLACAPWPQRLAEYLAN